MARILFKKRSIGIRKADRVKVFFNLQSGRVHRASQTSASLKKNASGTVQRTELFGPHKTKTKRDRDSNELHVLQKTSGQKLE